MAEGETIARAAGVELALVCPQCVQARGEEQPLVRAAPQGPAAGWRCPGCGQAYGRSAGGAPVLLLPGTAGAAASGPVPADPAAYYERARTREQYLALHYPPPDADPLAALLGPHAPPLAERYPLAVPALWRAAREPAGERRAPEQPGDATSAAPLAAAALDAGAACGRLSFELAREYGLVFGLDRSLGLIDAALAVQADGVARYERVIEGELTEAVEVALELEPAVRGRVRFVVGDALALPFPAGSFALVLALNLLDRVGEPRRLLAELARVTAPGGMLLVGSPYTWLEEFTPRPHWLGGLRDERGQARRGAQAVREALGAGWSLVREDELLFFIPHHARSGQLGRTHVQSFRRQR
ncbi:MAG: hypothetical protein KatS3mg102_2925 [Planctomycetota bacterium]|nr:MAG: hypothetical protein KatS3mg102_2925 [Planctomycetota bacterium]